MNIDTNKFTEKNIYNGLKLTNSALKQIQKILAIDPSIFGLRINIKTSGCAGFSYTLEKITLPNKDDWVYECNGTKLYISLKAMNFIDGIELDYVHEGLNYAFKFNNPRAKHICGCGESFNF